MSDYLCEQLIVEIFTRLPPKSLLRFRCLSKSLCSRIDSPDFIRMHTFRSPTKFLIRHRIYGKEYLNEGFYTSHSEDQLPTCPKRGYFGITPVDFPCSRYPNIIGSCNGTICLFDHVKGTICLWNPSVRRKLTLPDRPRPHQRCYFSGFGYDPTTDEYKIVCLSFPRHGGSTKRSFVYATKIGAWCAIPSPTNFFSFVTPKACFVNGALHWVVDSKSDDGELFYYILTFDLSNHVLGMIALPEPTWISRLTIIQGSLAVSSTKYGDSWIWVRRDASWSLVDNLKTNLVRGGIYRVLQLTANGDMLLDTSSLGFQVYNYKTGALSRLVDFNAASSIFYVVPYVESLQLLHTGTACD